MRQGGRHPLSDNHPPSVHPLLPSSLLCPSLPPPSPLSPSVYFYNYGWLDYGVPTLESILDMVKVVDFALRGGKVAIHCHAGLGRTGVLIACYLVYSQRMSGDETITLVRSNRCVVVRRPVVAVHTPSPLHIHYHPSLTLPPPSPHMHSPLLVENISSPDGVSAAGVSTLSSPLPSLTPACHTPSSSTLLFHSYFL